jgi:hypothetical protein
VISREELRQGYLDLVAGELDVLSEAGSAVGAEGELKATAPDAVVVCGYGEMRRRALGLGSGLGLAKPDP